MAVPRSGGRAQRETFLPIHHQGAPSTLLVLFLIVVILVSAAAISLPLPLILTLDLGGRDPGISPFAPFNRFPLSLSLFPSMPLSTTRLPSRLLCFVLSLFLLRRFVSHLSAGRVEWSELGHSSNRQEGAVQ